MRHRSWRRAEGGAMDEDGRTLALNYMPQLDTLRAIAVLCVLYSHYWEESSIAGSVAVRLFFVLSGFLITDILLCARTAAGALTTPPRHFVHFFVRRALRLWPAYYLILGAMLLLNIQHIRAVAPWHLFFASNILFAMRGDHIPWIAAPWWTLGVEEQFYLVWPFVILLPPRAWLKWLAGAAVLVGTMWHVAMARMGNDSLAAYYLLPASLDALGGGAALALAWRRVSLRPLYIAGALALLPLAALARIGSFGWEAEALSVMSMAALVAACAEGIGGRAGVLLGWRPLRLLGRISYGVYLYHMAVLAAFFALLDRYPTMPRYGPATFVLCGTAVIALAVLSWLLVERPVNRLKRRFPLRG